MDMPGGGGYYYWQPYEICLGVQDIFGARDMFSVSLNW